jgi:diguanylate cyclase
MAKQDSAMHPISFSIWYEHVAGMNAPLSSELERAMQTELALDEEATYALYRKYIAGLDEQSAQQVADGFRRVLSDLSDSANQAGKQASRFGSVLEEWSEGLLDGKSEKSLAEEAAGIIGDTRQMQDAVAVLNARLDSSKDEIERLQSEIVRAREEALSDGLTGLANRRGFDQSLADRMREATEQASELSLLLLDIDHFKNVNDKYGHLFGDKVIRSIAQVLKDNVKGRDTAARYGGEEFAVILPDTPPMGARAVAEKIRSTVANCRIQRVGNNETVDTISISIGVAHFTGGESPTDLIGRADSALYTSKSHGRNRVTVAARG